MTDHDQDAEIGAVIKEHAAAKRKRVALVAALVVHRKALTLFTHALESITPFDTLTSDTVPRMPENYPDPKVLAELLSELIATYHTIEHTRRLLKDAGVDLS